MSDNKIIDFKPLSFKEYSNFVGNSNLLNDLGCASVEMCFFNKAIVNSSGSLVAPTEGNSAYYPNENSSTFTVKLDQQVTKTTNLSSTTNTETKVFPSTASGATTAYTHSAIVCKVKGTVAKTTTTNGTETTVTPVYSENEMVIGFCCDFDNKKVKNMYFCQFGFRNNDTTNSDNAIMNKLTAYKVVCPEVGEFVWANGNYGIKVDGLMVFGIALTKSTTDNTYSYSVIVPEKSTFLQGIHAPSMLASSNGKTVPVLEVNHKLGSGDNVVCADLFTVTDN